MSKFTPGPWYVGKEDTETNEIEICSDLRPYICLVLPGAVGKWSEANARLIAAAPELLEALQGLDEAYCRAGSPLNRDERMEDRKRLIAARAAIAKAIGE